VKYIKFLTVIVFSLCLFIVGCQQSEIVEGPIVGPPAPHVPQVVIETVKEMNWLNVAGILGIGISVAAGAMGWRNFMAGVLGCGSILGLALFVERVKLIPQLYVDILALILIVGVGLLVILSIYKRVKALKVKDQALKEIIKGGDLFKKALKDRKELTMDTVMYDFICAHDSVQNPGTKAIVDSIQSPKAKTSNENSTPNNN